MIAAILAAKGTLGLGWAGASHVDPHSHPPSTRCEHLEGGVGLLCVTALAGTTAQRMGAVDG